MSRIAHATAMPDMLSGIRCRPHPTAQPSLKKCPAWNLTTDRDVPVEAPCFHLKSRMPRSEYTVNIFYIIGVIVVVLFVAGFFGLHV
jgi:hypothetical protein